MSEISTLNFSVDKHVKVIKCNLYQVYTTDELVSCISVLLKIFIAYVLEMKCEMNCNETHVDNILSHCLLEI
jgi:hypothetical protein